MLLSHYDCGLLPLWGKPLAMLAPVLAGGGYSTSLSGVSRISGRVSGEIKTSLYSYQASF